MREQEERHPHHFRGWVGFSIPVAHRIVAGEFKFPSFLYPGSQTSLTCITEISANPAARALYRAPA